MDELTPDSAETRSPARGGPPRPSPGVRPPAGPAPARLAPVRRAAQVDPKMRGRVDRVGRGPGGAVGGVPGRWGTSFDRRPMPFHVWLRKTAYQQAAHGPPAARRGRATGGRARAATAGSIVAALWPGGYWPAARRPVRAWAGSSGSVASIRSWRNCPRPTARSSSCGTSRSARIRRSPASSISSPAAARKRHGRTLIRLHALLAADGPMDSR